MALLYVRHIVICLLGYSIFLAEGAESVKNTNRIATNDEALGILFESLLERIQSQDERLYQLETTVADYKGILEQKENRINLLEKELKEIKLNLQNQNPDNKEKEVLKPEISKDGHGNDSRQSYKPLQVYQQNLTEREMSKRVNNVESGIAFSVSLTKDLTIHTHETVIYDDVLLDKGSGYSLGDGIYTVLTSGVYVFTWSITGTNTNDIIAKLLVNGLVRGSTYSDSTSTTWGSSTGVIVTSVNQGDHVCIRSDGTGLIISRTETKSTFSGWRLF